MGAAATHLVARQTLELRVGSEDQARELSGGIPALLERRLAPLLQELFDGLAPGGRHLRFGRIELDLGHIPSADLEAELPGRLRDALAARLRGATADEGPAPAPGPPQEQDAERAGLEMLEAFLRSGVLPWWVATPAQADLDAVACSLARRAPAALAAMLRRIMAPRVARRLATQFARETRALLLALLAGSEAPALAALAQRLVRRIEGANADSSRGGTPRAPGPAAEEAVCQALFEALAAPGAATHSSLEALALAALGRLPGEKPAPVAAPAGAEQPAEGREPPASAPAAKKSGVPARAGAAKAAGGKQVAPAPETGGTADTPAPRSRARHAPPAGTAQGPPSAAPGGRRRAAAGPGGGQQEALTFPERGLPAQQTPAPAGRGEAPRSREPRAPDSGTLAEKASGLFVENAGLVILWPFLARLFEALGLAREGRFLSEPAQERAALLLQHLAQGGSEWAEQRLPLNKLLCGLPLEAPLPRRIALDDTEERECAALLASVIAHWTALGQTSPRGLREGFLLRAGTLGRQESGWKLEVARAGRDVLLDQLPWGIGLVLLPWMEQPVFVQW